MDNDQMDVFVVFKGVVLILIGYFLLAAFLGFFYWAINLFLFNQF